MREICRKRISTVRNGNKILCKNVRYNDATHLFQTQNDILMKITQQK